MGKRRKSQEFISFCSKAKQRRERIAKEEGEKRPKLLIHLDLGRWSNVRIRSTPRTDSDRISYVSARQEVPGKLRGMRISTVWIDDYYEGELRSTPKMNFLGNQNCINNANSLYLQCAVNPKGCCNECSHFEGRL